MSDSNNKISHLVSTQVPFFVRNDHQGFITFLEKYYEYLEQSGKVVNASRNILNYRDIDRTTDDIADHLYSQFMHLLPEDMLADRTMILKHIRDFYRHCGNQKSVRFLIRILFNEDVEFYYPQRDILKASDGKWFIQKALRILNVTIDGDTVTDAPSYAKFANTQIQGANSNARAIVERTDRYFDRNSQIDEIILSNVDGEFESGEGITAEFTDSDGTHNIAADVYSGVITSLEIWEPGALYNIGDPVIISGNTGNGAIAYVSEVSTREINAIVVVTGGAGYSSNDSIVITGGGGTGANAIISSVLATGNAHPNSYNISLDAILLEANTAVGNAIYSNLNSANANVTYANALTYYTFSNLGPIQAINVTASGSDYTSLPTITAVSNTQLKSLGIVGTLSIVSGGSNYQIGDQLLFTNPYGSYGTGAAANVTNVNSANSNAITQVTLYASTGLPIGGIGYDQTIKPLITVNSANGIGANVIVSNLLGYGATFTSSNTAIGMIEAVVIASGGSAYGNDATANMTGYGDGTALINVRLITGVYSYPGRFLNDDGFISSANFLQGRDYYQKYSYVVRSAISVKEYESFLMDLIHPAGTKFFGELVYSTQIAMNVATDSSSYSNSTVYFTSYAFNNTTNHILINNPTTTDNLVNLIIVTGASNLVVEFESGELLNISTANGTYNIASQNATLINVSANYYGYRVNTHTGNATVRLFQ